MAENSATGLLPPFDDNAEKALLGSILLNSKLLEEVGDVLKGVHFYDARHALVFSLVVELWSSSRPVDILTVLDLLKLKSDLNPTFSAAIDKDYLLELISKSSLLSSSSSAAKIIRDKYFLRELINISDKIKSKSFEEKDRVEEVLEYAQKEIYQISEQNIEKNFTPISDVLSEVFERISNAKDSGETMSGTPTGLNDLDGILGGFHAGDLIILAARPSMGKAQPLNTPVKTLDGWCAIKDLEIGTQIASVDGKPSTVMGIFPQGKKMVYRITFADGRSTLCCDEHLWDVNYRDWKTKKTLTTLELRNKLTKQRYINRMYIETTSGDFGHNDPLLIHPYLLGCLLGDGGLTGNTPMFSNQDTEVLDRVKSLLSEDLKLVHSSNYDYRISQKNSHATGVVGVTLNPITIELKKLGIMGKDATQKSIPQTYLLANKNSRIELLRGLLDTDGWVESFGSIRFCTISSQLAQDVQELTRSLGGYSEIKTKKTTFTYKGTKKNGQLAYVLTLTGIEHFDLFTIEAKKSRVSKKIRTKRLNITSIIEESIQETACILVSHPSHLYLTDHYIVTHNTSLALEVVKRMAIQEQTGIAFFSLEMGKDQLVDKLLSSTAGIELRKIRNGQLENMDGNDEFLKLGEAMGTLNSAKIWIDDSGHLNITELRTKARRLKSRYNIGLLVIDYLQLMSGNSGVNYGSSRVQEVSDISRALKMLAKELELPVLALSQLSRGVESREDKRPMLSDLRESGSIEQDADVVVFVHRDEMYNPDSKNKGKANIIIAKHRNGETGTVELAWIGRLATFGNLEGAVARVRKD
jgi:replicative DNA helicase